LRQSRREKRERCDDEFNSEILFITSFDWFFFLTCFEEATVFWHIKKARENAEREQRKEKKRIRRRRTQTHAKRKKFLYFLVEKCLSKLHHFSQNIREYFFVGKFSLTTNDALLERRLIKREYEEGKIMSASCARCGYTIYLREASELISCQSCNLTHATETLFNDADDDDDENEDALVTTGGGKKMMKTISNAASFLYKFNIEPKNPDGTKIGSERDDENVSRERRATVDEPCPKCDNHVLRFYTMQLRSADEGQTVFYECEKCKHTFSQNN
jgi:DNA-directed RNA polymerase I subunit RPA12